MPRSERLRNDKSPAVAGLLVLTGATGLEPATSGVTGRRSNQLSYAPRARRRRIAPYLRARAAGPGAAATWRRRAGFTEASTDLSPEVGRCPM